MHRMIVLWSHPRSMSTATERVMRERGDLWCAHEPFLYDYYVHRAVRTLPHFDIQPDQPTEYSEIRDGLLARAEEGPVFFKDMAFYVIPQILSDPAFLSRLTHVFLIRNPVASLLSYHKLDPDLTREEVGIEAQWKLYDALGERGLDRVVIEAETVQRDARGTMSALWRKIDLPVVEGAFAWQGETPDEWEQVGGWHGAVSASEGIRQVSPEDAARDLAEKDRALRARAEQAPHLLDLLDHHRVFYERLKSVAISV